MPSDPVEPPAEASRPQSSTNDKPAPKLSAPGELGKVAWALPFVRFDKAWTQLESRLCGWVLIAEIIALCMWIALKGLSAEYQVGGEGEKNVSGLVFRGLLTAALLGFVAHKATKPRIPETAPEFARVKQRQRVVVTTASIVGLLAGRLWANAGVEYFSNLLNWMQNASLLMLVGGLRGVATRLTLWLALLGASIATAKGKHINIDVVMRFLTPRMRVPAAVLGWVAAAAMCFAGAYGFVDHIAIALFHAPPSEPCKDDPTTDCRVSAHDKLAHVGREVSTDLFLIGRQLSLDVRSLPRVIVGIKYNGYLSGREWNDWILGSSWGDHFKPDEVQGLLAAPERVDQPHAPAVSIPGGEEARGLLIKDADFIFPFGLLMIALRFLLRSLLVLTGWAKVDPDAAHEEEEVEESHADAEAALHAATKGGV